MCGESTLGSNGSRTKTPTPTSTPKHLDDRNIIQLRTLQVGKHHIYPTVRLVRDFASSLSHHTDCETLLRQEKVKHHGRYLDHDCSRLLATSHQSAYRDAISAAATLVYPRHAQKKSSHQVVVSQTNVLLVYLCNLMEFWTARHCWPISRFAIHTKE